ncbi:hypothetical protein LJR235_002857 [Pararhizobium sp. LjRoot235]|uniref:hypothetical protein n=1 Tax=Pararhizobium sp. LjRoot235 TaxID=3342291 RepID=UPI003ECF3449
MTSEANSSTQLKAALRRGSLALARDTPHSLGTSRVSHFAATYPAAAVIATVRDWWIFW